MQHFSLLIKPTSHGCNLRCTYCFYLKKKEFYQEALPRMSQTVLESMITSFQALDLVRFDYAWQGGEPLLMGLDFYEEASRLQKKYARDGKKILNSLQTNGTLIDDEWAKFFATNNYLIGLSCDGPAFLHNVHRQTINGQGSHDQVMRGRKILRRHSVDYNILTVVSAANVGKPIEVYTYFRDELGEKFHQYIECVEFDKRGKLVPWAVRGRQFGEFMCSIFDEWYTKDRFTVSVRLFDIILSRIVDKTVLSCPFASDCRQYFVVEHNGDIYPCDFHVDPQRWLLGNLNTGTWSDFLHSPIYAEFGSRKKVENKTCAECEFLEICRGCCPKNRWGSGHDSQDISVLCEGWKLFYSHTLERFQELAALVVKQREQTLNPAVEQIPTPNTAGNIRRNAPCPCGSSKKYKQCCGREGS